MPRKPRITIEIVNDGKPHDEKICFRCRLHELFIELHELNDPTLMVLALAEAAGSILAQLSDNDKNAFMAMLTKTYYEDKNNQTKH